MATATIPPEPSALNIAVSDTCEGWFRLATKEVADAYVCKDLLNIKEDPNATNFILVPNMQQLKQYEDKNRAIYDEWFWNTPVETPKPAEHDDRIIILYTLDIVPPGQTLDVVPPYPILPSDIESVHYEWVDPARSYRYPWNLHIIGKTKQNLWMFMHINECGVSGLGCGHECFVKVSVAQSWADIWLFGLDDKARGVYLETTKI